MASALIDPSPNGSITSPTARSLPTLVWEEGAVTSEVAGSGHIYAVEGRAHLPGALRELLHGPDHGQPRRLEAGGLPLRWLVFNFGSPLHDALSFPEGTVFRASLTPG